MKKNDFFFLNFLIVVYLLKFLKPVFVSLGLVGQFATNFLYSITNCFIISFCFSVTLHSIPIKYTICRINTLRCFHTPIIALFFAFVISGCVIIHSDTIYFIPKLYLLHVVIAYTFYVPDGVYIRRLLLSSSPHRRWVLYFLRDIHGKHLK